ncbi:MAG: DUF2147 domain-containing protein [Rhodobacteraceae bacterium]|nr:DUF2147 domain-containing protein [Paracoccaceae bacterium]
MKFALALVFAGAASAAHTDPVYGLWQTQPGDDGAYGQVEIAACGPAICGTLVRGFDAEGRQGSSDAIGRKIVWDMTPQGGGSYGGGKIWAPDRDKTYSSKMTLDGTRLKVSGCVAVLCRSQVWTRVQ